MPKFENSNATFCVIFKHCAYPGCLIKWGLKGWIDPENDAGLFQGSFSVLILIQLRVKNEHWKDWVEDDEYKTCDTGKRKCYSLEVEDLQ